MKIACQSATKMVALFGSMFGCLIVLGCGDDTGLAKRYPVYGTVTYQDKPVASGNINFIPKNPGDGRAAASPIENGSYKLTTATQGDGALPGDYIVTVTAVEIDTSKLKSMAGGGQHPHTKEFFEANKNAKNLVPLKYASMTTSELKVQVKEESNKFDFVLKD